jgi:hypothetical protein
MHRDCRVLTLNRHFIRYRRFGRSVIRFSPRGEGEPAARSAAAAAKRPQTVILTAERNFSVRFPPGP